MCNAHDTVGWQAWILFYLVCTIFHGNWMLYYPLLALHHLVCRLLQSAPSHIHVHNHHYITIISRRLWFDNLESTQLLLHLNQWCITCRCGSMTHPMQCIAGFEPSKRVFKRDLMHNTFHQFTWVSTAFNHITAR